MEDREQGGERPPELAELNERLQAEILERRQIEESLRQSEKKYRDLTEFLPQPIFEIDEEGRILFGNRAAFEMFDITKEDFERGLNILRFVDPEDQGRAAENLKKILTDQERDSKEYRLRRKDGSPFHALITASPIVEGGCPRGLRGTIVDITERKKVEDAVHRLAREREIMAELGRIINSTLNIDEVYERFACEVHKIIPFDRIVINMINPERDAATIAYTWGTMIDGRRQGDAFPLKGSLTERVMNTRESLLIREENREEMIGQFSGLSKFLEAGFRSMMVVPLLSKDQVMGVMSLPSTKPNLFTDTDLKQAESISNQIAGAMANAQLFVAREKAESEKMAIEEQFRQSQKMEAVGRLAGGVAHDFNNLLTVIQGNCQLASLQLKGEDPLKGNVDEIHKATERAAALTRQLLAFSRRQIMQFEVLDLNLILKNLEQMLRRIIGEDIHLKTSLERNLGRVKTDPGQIEQTIVNLVVNARDAMPRGGKLIIETANVDLDEEFARAHVGVVPGAYVRLSVSDTGVGMTQEIRDHIFEPFFTTKEKGKGTGLGLSTVYGIVNQSRGNIWVYSEPGQGTSFKIHLPRVDGATEDLTERKAGRREAPRGKECILLVEDEDAVRKLAAIYLAMQGYNVLEARHAVDALLICKKYQDRIHVMVTDVVMPGMSGKRLAEELHPLRPDMKVLYMSGYTDDAIGHLGVLGTGTSFLQKPFRLEDLAAKVRDILDGEG